MPFVFVTCGRWRHYHTTSATPDKLDYEKLAGASRFVDRLARAALAGDRPRFDPEARDHATTVATLLDLARGLSARPAVKALEAIQRRVDPHGRLSLSDWSTVLRLLAALEQGLA